MIGYAGWQPWDLRTTIGFATRCKDANFYIRGFTMSTTDNYFDEEPIGLYKKVKVTLESTRSQFL